MCISSSSTASCYTWDGEFVPHMGTARNLSARVSFTREGRILSVCHQLELTTKLRHSHTAFLLSGKLLLFYLGVEGVIQIKLQCFKTHF